MCVCVCAHARAQALMHLYAKADVVEIVLEEDVIIR